MRPLIHIVLLVVIVGQVSSDTGKQSKIGEVAHKFELFGKDTGKETSGVSYDELDEAYEDYKIRYGDEKFRQAAREKSKMFRLLDDLVLTPMALWRLSSDEDEATKAAYLRRTEKFFKLFWPGYIRGKLVGKKLMYNAKKFIRFLGAFDGKSEERPTKRMWHLARLEYDGLKQRADEMVANEDIYSLLNEYALMVNFFNEARVGLLRRKFFDRLDNCKSDEEMLELRAEYQELRSSSMRRVPI